MKRPVEQKMFEETIEWSEEFVGVALHALTKPDRLAAIGAAMLCLQVARNVLEKARDYNAWVKP